MAYPAVNPVTPHASPAPRCTKPANNEYSFGVTAWVYVNNETLAADERG